MACNMAVLGLNSFSPKVTLKEIISPSWEKYSVFFHIYDILNLFTSSARMISTAQSRHFDILKPDINVRCLQCHIYIHHTSSALLQKSTAHIKGKALLLK